MKPTASVRLVLAAALLLAVVAAPSAQAASYIITLTSGDVFQSRYQPETASFDDGMLLLLTEFGNWIALPKSEVADVTTDVESRGFGKVIDTKTISLGVLPNDALVPTEEPETSAVDRLQQALLERQLNPPVYNVDQFVEPGQAGSGTGGLPAGYGAQGSSTGLVNP